MNYTVTWVPSGDALLRILIGRPDRAAVVSALDRIGSVLAREGPAAGESRDQNLRILFALPLAVIFSVEEPEHTITVKRIWTIAR